MQINQYHVIKDPVHGTMQFTTVEDQWIKPFIKHPLFQRLRHIKQLGLGDYVFPGAVHTRFNHSLGCCYVASQVAHKLELPFKDQQVVMIAALLHDIGHGPFSHAFEDLFFDKMIRHEDWTPHFLAELNNAQFISAYNAVNAGYPLSEGLFKQIQAIIMHHPSNNPLLADIVSSQLDADRFDYLLRDSHFCGVKYGEYDFRWLLHCLAEIDYQGKKRLGVTYKGIGAVEQYLNARRLMMRNIYHHSKKYAVEFMLVEFLKLLAKHLDDWFPELANNPLGLFLRSVNAFNQNPTQENKQVFLSGQYNLYCRLTDYDIFTALRTVAESQKSNDAVEIAKRIYYRHLPKVYPLNQLQYEKAKDIVAELQYPRWQLALLHMPHQSYQGDTDPILVQFQNSVKPLGDVSLMVNALTDKFESHYYLSIDSSLLEHQKLQAMMSLIEQGE